MTTTTTTTSDVVRGSYEGYDAHDLPNNWEGRLSHELVNHTSGRTDREGWLGPEQSYLSAFPDPTVTVLVRLSEGSKVASGIEMTGTQKEFTRGTHIPTKENSHDDDRR